MGNLLLNDVLDQKVEQAEELFRTVLEESLRGFLEREVTVQAQGPQEFDFKELKAALPGEVVIASMTVTEGGPGKVQFVMGRETAGKLGDLLLLGNGSTPFSHEEHLEPIRDMFREVMVGFSGRLAEDVGHGIGIDDVKAALVDLTPADFVGTVWMINRLDIGLDTPESVFQIISLDFWQACFPDNSVAAGDEPETYDEPVKGPEIGKEMGLVLDIELPISIELGRTTMLIRDIIRLAPGSIVELDKLSGEPVDLFVNGRLFARGEVVVVDENFAVRLTEIISPHEIVRSRRN
ncbi:MAG: flagellar motor switch protein FliN [bacterium]|nr:flagellar motor switch protein FliN [bacterium]